MTPKFPHEGVLVRLGVSPIHGIGVFALCDILAGTNVFANDQRPLTWVEEGQLEALGLEPHEQALYQDFAIRRGGRLGCPANFNFLSPGWYLNEAPAGQAPNISPDPNDNLIATRPIVAGEELTLRYADYSNKRAEAATPDRVS